MVMKEPRSITEGMSAEGQRLYESWLSSRPESVRALAAEFPLGTVVGEPPEDRYIIGYTEGDGVVLSAIWPADDYQASIAQKRHAHAAHLRDGSVSVRPPG